MSHFRQQNQHFSDRVHAAVRLIPAIVVILILATQSFAAARMGSGEWIEICGENGAELVQIDGVSPEGDDGNCPDCGDCLFCAVASASMPPQLLQHVPIDCPPAPVLPGTQFDHPVAAQFWHQSRGPPLGNKHYRRAPTW